MMVHKKTTNKSNLANMVLSNDHTPAFYNLAKLEFISKGNPEFIIKMVKLFADHLPIVIGDIRKAYTEQRFDTISKLAHSIKPSIDSMGIISLYDEIRAIENFIPQKHSTIVLEQNITQLENVSSKVLQQLIINFSIPNPG